MKSKNAPKLSAAVIADIKHLANLARWADSAERDLYWQIKSLAPEHQIELLSLYLLGHGPMRSFDAALSEARSYPLRHVAVILAESRDLAKCLTRGVGRRKRCSA
jgi:hypothetical protein